jgi:hypothetical protein
VYVEGGQERGTGVPGVVDADTRDTGILAVCVEGAVQAPWFDGRAVLHGEHQVRLLPSDASHFAGLVLQLATLVER